MSAENAAFGVWAKCCRDCQTVEVVRDYDALVAVSEKHKGHYTTLAGGRDVVTAADMAKHLSEPFEGIYWEQKVDEYLTQLEREAGLA